MAEKTGNLILILILGGFGLYYFLDVRSLPNAEERLIVENLFWFLVVLLVIEASRTIYQIWRDRKKEKKMENSLQNLIKAWLFNKPVMLMVGLTVYIILFPLIGFFVTSFLFLVGFSFFLGSRKFWELSVIPVISLAFLYFIFVYFLEIRLPKGIFI